MNNQIENGVIEANGQKWMINSKGDMTPIDKVHASQKLEDEMVREIFADVEDLSRQVAELKPKTIDHLNAFKELLFQEYKVTKGGKDGNVTYHSFDGLLRIVLRMQVQYEMGPERQAAESLIEECLEKWGKEAKSKKFVNIVRHILNSDSEKEISTSVANRLLTLKEADPDWVRAMDVLRIARREIGRKAYLYFQTRKSVDQVKWDTTTINLAAV